MATRTRGCADIADQSLPLLTCRPFRDAPWEHRPSATGHRTAKCRRSHDEIGRCGRRRTPRIHRCAHRSRHRIARNSEGAAPFGCGRRFSGRSGGRRRELRDDEPNPRCDRRARHPIDASAGSLSQRLTSGAERVNPGANRSTGSGPVTRSALDQLIEFFEQRL